MTNGSYFKGTPSLLPAQGLYPGVKDKVEPLFGQVLETTYDSSDANEIGKINVRVYKKDQNPEEDVKTIAYPANRNMVMYPLPGELVLLTYGMSDNSYKGKTVPQLYYTSIVSSAGNITNNSNPYYLDFTGYPVADEYFTKEREKRFELKFKNAESFITDGLLQNRASIQPFEGDIILQGRWGAHIRLGSSGFDEESSWSDKKSISGNAITAMVVNRNKSSGTYVENINKDDSSIYMTGTLKVPITVATSKNLKTFSYTYNVGPGTAQGDATSFLPSAFVEDSGMGGFAPVGTSTQGTSFSGTYGAGTYASDMDLMKVSSVELDKFIMDVVWKVLANQGKSKNYPDIIPLDGGTVGIAHFAVGGLAGLYNMMGDAMVLKYFGKDKNGQPMTVEKLSKYYSDKCIGDRGGKAENDTPDNNKNKTNPTFGCYSGKYNPLGINWRAGMTAFLTDSSNNAIQDKAVLKARRKGVEIAAGNGWKTPFELATAIGITNSGGNGMLLNLGKKSGWDAKKTLDAYVSDKVSGHREKRRDLIYQHFPPATGGTTP